MVKEAMISTIQKYSTKDGPGIRSTVFFVGCNLRCKWCSNPELIKFGYKYMIFEERCTKCGLCETKAPAGAVDFSGERIRIDREKLNNISEISALCPANVFELVGRKVTVDDLFAELMRDKVFYDTSGGGVTFSGGDPMLFGGFLKELAAKLKAENVQVAIDTAGNYMPNRLKEVVEYADIFLYDIKAFDETIHRECTGVENKLILNNAKTLVELGKELIVRMVIVPGQNDQLEDMIARIDFIASLGPKVTRLDILRYHELGVGKYQRLGMVYPLNPSMKCDETAIRTIYNYALEKGINATIE
ncbi:pyruvate formate lyase activating enzyme [Enterococcus sp. AZ135]|uniref:glycyl-radical enzyme activating protein n=1 Tax=unclassified Enterococcus TaxID=2608891 RepID=UPI003F298B2A